MIDRNKFESLEDALRSVEDLDALQIALSREIVIRSVMKECDESWEAIAKQIDAYNSANNLAVLELTGQQPATLREALNNLVTGPIPQDPVDIVFILNALLNHQFPDDQKREDSENSTWMEFIVTWRPVENGHNYYRIDERRTMLERWIEAALVDRADSPGAHFGQAPQGEEDKEK